MCAHAYEKVFPQFYWKTLQFAAALKGHTAKPNKSPAQWQLLAAAIEKYLAAASICEVANNNLTHIYWVARGGVICCAVQRMEGDRRCLAAKYLSHRKHSSSSAVHYTFCMPKQAACVCRVELNEPTRLSITFSKALIKELPLRVQPATGSATALLTPESAITKVNNQRQCTDKDRHAVCPCLVLCSEIIKVFYLLYMFKALIFMKEFTIVEDAINCGLWSDSGSVGQLTGLLLDNIWTKFVCHKENSKEGRLKTV